jgi:hypothetical protein
MSENVKITHRLRQVRLQQFIYKLIKQAQKDLLTRYIGYHFLVEFDYGRRTRRLYTVEI